MGGGLLNLVATGENNKILNSNPSKTFFKTTYAKYTNFGLQIIVAKRRKIKTGRESRWKNANKCINSNVRLPKAHVLR